MCQVITWKQDEVTTCPSPQRARLSLQSACHILFDFLSQKLIAGITGKMKGINTEGCV